MSHAEFAPVAPIQILETLLSHDRRDLFGDYHLFLAHHTVEQPQRFGKLIRDYYGADRSTSLSQLTIIMDNSIVELGGAVDDDMIYEAVQIIHGQNRHTTVIPCLPDVMRQGPDTIDLSSDAYERWKDLYDEATQFMVVTQGKDWGDFKKTVDHFFVYNLNMYQKITWVGIPRVLVDSLGGREDAVKYVKMVAPHVNIHLLGFSDNMVDDLMVAKYCGVRGIDSAVPIRCSQLMAPSDFIPKRDPKWFELGMCGPTQELNIRNVRKWIR